MCGVYRKQVVPVSLDVLQVLEARLAACYLDGSAEFTCNLVASAYADKLKVDYSSREPQRMRDMWAEFLVAINVIEYAKSAMRAESVPRWLKALHRGGTLNELRLALVRDIIREVSNA